MTDGPFPPRPEPMFRLSAPGFRLHPTGADEWEVTKMLIAQREQLAETRRNQGLQLSMVSLGLCAGPLSPAGKAVTTEDIVKRARAFADFLSGAPAAPEEPTQIRAVK